MKCYVRSLSVAVLCLGALVWTLSANAETRRAVIVGINQYVIPGATLIGRGDPPDTRFWTNLGGAKNDAVRMRDLLVARYGFARNDIVELYDQQATRAAIVKAIEDQLIDKTQPGDVAYFYYAGHGSRVRNSLSPELDKLDESLVPADAATGARDIRDKELRDLINRIIDKGGIVTVVLDSCHSGSATRGPAGQSPFTTRMLPLDPRDVRDNSQAPSPWERGALVISAAQKDQLANEVDDEFGIRGGLFSMSLARAMRNSRSDEPVQNLFRRVSSQMKATGKQQDPGIEATATRRAQSLFGGTGVGPTGRSVASVQSRSDGEVTLQAGIAAGLTVGTELVKVSEPAVRIVIKSIKGLVTSHADIVAGDANTIEAGDLFVVDNWAPPDVPNLRVWVPSTDRSKSALVQFGTELAQAIVSLGHSWVQDPTMTIPSHIIRHTGETWEFIANENDAEPVSLGASPTIDSIVRRLPSSDGKVASVYLNLPAPESFSQFIKIGAGTNNSAIEFSSDEQGADYHLIGRLSGGQLSYAWVRPWVSSASESTMPWITDWVSLGQPNDAAARKIEALAVKLGYISAWLRLEGPPESREFPYKLMLKAQDKEQYLVDGVVRDGDTFSLTISADQSSMTDIAWRYVYVFAIDRNGTSTLLYPLGGATQNRYPPEEDAESPKPAYVLPDSTFDIGPPYGIDTFVLIATTTQLPDPTVLESAGVRTRSAGAGGYSFADLLADVGSRTRAAKPRTVPTKWSIQRISLQSKRKE